MAALEAGVGQLFEDVGKTYYSEEADWLERVEKGLEAFLTVLANNPAFSRFFAVEANRASPELRERAQEVLSLGYTPFFVEKASTNLNDSTNELAQFVGGGMFAAISEVIQKGLITDLPKLAPTLTTFILALYQERIHPRSATSPKRKGVKGPDSRTSGSPSKKPTKIPKRAAKTAIALPGSLSPMDPSRALVAGASLPREHVTEIQRSRLIDAMVLVASESGIENAGVRSVCQRAGVAFSTFYQHFDSKDDLFLAAFDSGVDVLFEKIGETYLTGDISWATRAEITLRYFLEILADNPSFAKFLAVEAGRVSEPLKSKLDVTFQRAYDLFVSAEPVSDLPTSSYEFAQIIVGGIHAVIYATIQRGQVGNLPELTTNLVSYIIALSRADQSARTKVTQ